MQNVNFGKIHRFWKETLFLLLLIGMYFICYTRKIALSREHLFWTFSTVMQSFVALGALLGMVAVFKLQVINNRIENLVLNVREKMQYFEGTPEDVLHEGQKRLEEDLKLSTLQYRIPQLEKLFDEEKKIKKQIADFVKGIITVTIFALIFLIFTPLIIKIYADVVSLGVILYLAIPSLVATIRLIKEIL